MSATQTTTAPVPAAPRSGGRTRRTPKDGPHVAGGSREARQLAAVILEVLAGVIRPAQAVQVLGVSLPRYYTLERRALRGLVRGCEPVSLGRKARNPQKDVEQLQKRVARLEQDCARYQALARASQRAVGLSAPKDQGKAKPGRRRRTPTVRALKVAQSLKRLEPAGEERDG
jgi:hypothetical protein